MNTLKSLKYENILKYCNDQAILVSANGTSDIDEIELFCQLLESNSSPKKKIELVHNHLIQRFENRSYNSSNSGVCGKKFFEVKTCKKSFKINNE